MSVDDRRTHMAAEMTAPTTKASMADDGLDPALVASLRTAIRGEVIAPADPGYERARKVYNGMIDRHPALVVRASDVADVIAAVTFAGERGLPLAVRGGGHNVA